MVVYDLYPKIALIVVLSVCVILGGCSGVSRIDGRGYSSTGSIDWNWNRIPQGGSDEKSSSAPPEPAD